MQSESDMSKSGNSGGGTPAPGRGRTEPGPGVGDEVTPDRPAAGRSAQKLDTGGGVGDDRVDPVESLKPMGGLGTGTTEGNAGVGGASGRLSDGAGSVAEAGGAAQEDRPLADPAGPSEGTGGDTPYRPNDRPM